MSDPAPVYLIHGDDPHLIDEAVMKIRGGQSELDSSVFGPEDEPGAVVEAIRTPSLLGDRWFVVVKGIDKMPAAAQKLITQVISEPISDVTVILIAEKPGRLAAEVRKHGRVVEAGKGKRGDLLAWVRKLGTEKKIKLTSEGVNALVEAVGEDRNALANAIEELVLSLGPKSTVGPTEVRGQFTGGSEGKIFGFIDAVAARHHGEALMRLDRLLKAGESAQGVYWMLNRHFRMLLSADGTSSQVAQQLGIPDWRAEKLVRQARGFSSEELKEIWVGFAETDRRIKASEESEQLALERLVVKIGSASSRS